jgi:hypothetical protein
MKSTFSPIVLYISEFKLYSPIYVYALKVIYCTINLFIRDSSERDIATVPTIATPIPCGGGVEYLHES